MKPTGFFNDAYDVSDTAGGIPLRVVMQNHGHVTNGRGVRGHDNIVHPDHVHKSDSTSSSIPPTPVSVPPSSSHYDTASSYQLIKWSPFHQDTWTKLHDITGKEL